MRPCAMILGVAVALTTRCSLVQAFSSRLMVRLAIQDIATRIAATRARTRHYASKEGKDDSALDSISESRPGVVTLKDVNKAKTTSSANINNDQSSANRVPPEQSINVQINNFFRTPVPRFAREQLDVYREQGPDYQKDFDVISLLTAKPGSPAVPRPLWAVIFGSVPTGLLWYGYYKFCVEEELLQAELAAGKTPRGFGGYGTWGPFVYGILLGPLAELLHLPGGLNWSNVGIFFIYYTQFLLYERVNEMYKQQGQEPPLTVWWCLPIFFPFDLIVGLRQVHFLSDYYYRQRGVANPPKDPVVDFFPFIAANRFTWVDFVLTPSLWCKLLDKVEPLDRTKFPALVQDLFELGDGVKRPGKE